MSASPSSETSQEATRPPRLRSARRNVHIYDLNDPEKNLLGGMLPLHGITNANVYAMVEIIVIFQSTFALQKVDETILERDDNALQPGDYYIVSNSPFELNNESWLTRTISQATGERVKPFQEAVRFLDRQCIMFRLTLWMCVTPLAGRSTSLLAFVNP